jgi:hypothetical protein
MKTRFKLAGGPLSYLHEVTVDLELKGKHFEDLSQADDDVYERSVLSVLTDLMDEDPFQLTSTELYHVFLLVKVTSLGPKLDMNVSCQHSVKTRTPAGDGERICGASNTFEYSLLESDIVYAPKNYKVPEVLFTQGGVEQLYQVRPPTMTQVLDLFAYFQERGVSRRELLRPENKALRWDFAKHNMLLYLRNVKTGDSFFDRKQREEAVKDIADNPLSFTAKVGKIIEEEDSFGVSHKRLSLVCKECGGKLTFRLPLSAGLSL